MSRQFIISAILFLSLFASRAQQTDSLLLNGSTPASPVHLNLKIDIPVTAIATIWTLYGFAQTSKHDGSSVETVTALKTADINWFDRWAVLPYNETADNISYLPFYGAVAYPFVFFMFDKKMRKDFMKLSFIYLEAMTITGAIYGTAINYGSRYRPFVYSDESPMELRLSPNARKAFFAGHVALVATSTFFVAGLFAQYHPESNFKWMMYGIAAALTLTTGYLRHEAGEHFPSDILVGTAVGTLSGLLVPALHKTKILKNKHLSIFPYGGETSGIIAFYKF